MVLALYGKRALARDANLSSEGRGFGGIPLAYNVRQRTDVEALFAEVQAGGCDAPQTGDGDGLGRVCGVLR